MSATVLCVQEDPKIYAVYAEVLEAEGYQVLPAHDGGQALGILRKQSPDFVVLDVSLPRQDGFEILTTLRRLPATRDLPVLLLCPGDVTPDLADRGKRLRAIAVEPAPIETDRLVACVRKHVKAESAPAATAGGSRVAKGTLRELPFPELLHALHLEKFDGVLLLEHGKKKKAVELRKGWPAAVKSNLVSECLGAYLVKRGVCTKEQLAESVERMRAGEGLQGEILVAMEVLEEDGVVEALKDHALEKLYEVFGWLDGAFVTKRGARLQRGNSIGIEGHPSALIVEGVRRYVSSKLVDRFIAQRAEEPLFTRRADPGRIAEVHLRAAEIEWLRGLDDAASLGTLSAEPEEIRRAAFGLISVELLEVGDPSESSAAGKAAATASAPPASESEMAAGAAPADESAGSDESPPPPPRRDRNSETQGQRALQAETEFQKGEGFLATREYESALRCFGRAMEVYPSEGEYRAHYGWTLYLCKPDNSVMLEEALEHCREGVKLAKDREKPYLLLGRLYKAMGKNVAAKKMFARAVRIQPRCVEALRELRLLNMRSDKEKGVLKRLFRR